MRGIQILFRSDPHVALLDLLNEELGIEFLETSRKLEQLRRLGFIPNILRRDCHTVLMTCSQRKFAHRVDPAKEFPAFGQNGPVADGAVPVDPLLADAFATPVFLIHNACYARHGLPRPARILRIDLHEDPGETAGLPSFHKCPCGRAHEKGGRLGAVDQEVAVGKFRRLNSHLVAGDAQLARGRDGPITLDGDEIGGKLLRLRAGAAAEQ